MEKLFYTTEHKYGSTENAIRHVLTEFFSLNNVRIARTERGKPYLVDAPLFFSVSHTDGKLFIAVSDRNVGIDAELTTRVCNYETIVKKFPDSERAQIRSQTDFLRHWTVKESAVKYLGGTLAHDLYALRYAQNELFYKNVPLPVYIAFPHVENYTVAVCAERDFSQTNVIIL